ncbi:hypothetical protein AAF712_012203 [Marasmius tenuissimus]|uniref:C2H2-type domain-containing protein n=1 Tax=Marasmius tenuissimus TaxID=585030 RepID=A0ABR2ZKI3_9AGAR
MELRTCLEQNCFRRTTNQKEANHKAGYRSKNYSLSYQDAMRTMLRKIDCPCGAPPHQKHNFYKIYALCKLAVHPAPDDPGQYLDDPFFPYSAGTLATLRAHFGDTPYTIEELPEPTYEPEPPTTTNNNVDMASGGNDKAQDVDMDVSAPPDPSPPHDTANDEIASVSKSMAEVEISDGELTDCLSNGSSVSDSPGDDDGTEDEALVTLRRYNIYIDPTYCQTICTAAGCRAIIPFNHVHSHHKKNHTKR